MTFKQDVFEKEHYFQPKFLDNAEFQSTAAHAERDILHEVNTFESYSLANSWTAPDFFSAISKFLSQGR